MQEVLLVKYGEIILRGKNRHLVENMLIKTIIKNLKKVGNYWVSKEQGRILIESKEENGKFDFENVIPLVVNILGITAVCPAIKLDDSSIESIRENALNHMKEQWKNEKVSFKVETKRSDKQYPMTSKEISMDIGGYVFDNMENLTVDVHNPDVTLMVEIRNFVYIYSKLIKGFGGLPIGTSGKATVLLSGGIDSPVASFMMAKRGVNIEAVYFNSPPYTSDRAKQKVIDLAERLSIFTGSFKLYIVPFTDVQLKIYESVPPEKMTILLKRAMLKVSEKIAIENGSLGLVTGDSIGQVASQTMQAIDAISSAVTKMPIFRPLCAMDKQEIIDIARKLGTYDISIRPYEDCCTIFVAKHPETKPKKNIIEKIEQNIDGLDEKIEECIKNIEIIEF
ncbi:MAG: tRNA 4-thiouridine(8) synthase ThiI [Eubacteriales bacterium]|nr:tRNA 4-thiouridine(8) synthase ThiI [Eubacteriales bacterium]